MSVSLLCHGGGRERSGCGSAPTCRVRSKYRPFSLMHASSKLTKRVSDTWSLFFSRHDLLVRSLPMWKGDPLFLTDYECSSYLANSSQVAWRVTT